MVDYGPVQDGSSWVDSNSQVKPFYDDTNARETNSTL